MAIYKGHGHVWDKEKNEMLCEFKNGEYRTCEPRTKDILIRLGYEYCIDDEIVTIEDEVVTIEDTPFADMGVRDLKSYCKEKGYEGYSNLSKDDLLAFLEEREG